MPAFKSCFKWLTFSVFECRKESSITSGTSFGSIGVNAFYEIGYQFGKEKDEPGKLVFATLYHPFLVFLFCYSFFLSKITEQPFTKSFSFLTTKNV